MINHTAQRQCSQQVTLFLAAAEPHGINQSDVRDFLKDALWEFPLATKHGCNALWRVFDIHRSSSSDPGKVRASSSELLSLYGLLRHFVQTRVPDVPDLRAARKSFEAACYCIDLILLAKRRTAAPENVQPQLQAALVDHLQLHKTAYGTDNIRPKHHWQLDMCKQLSRDKCVLDAFIIERMHLIVKAIADNVRNTKSFEASVLAGVLNTTIEARKDYVGTTSLHGKRWKVPGFNLAVASRALTMCSAHVGVGDVVFRGEAAGRVVACIQECGAFLVLVDSWTKLGQIATQSCKWNPSGERVAWLAEHVESALAWYSVPDGVVVVRM